ncbi:MAG: serine O-acetyltransferase [Candidatus Rokuibacteriota bacterium]
MSAIADPPEEPGLFELIREDWRVNGRAWTRPGFRAVAVHRFGQWAMRRRSRVLRLPLVRFYHALFTWVRNHHGIELYLTTQVGRRFCIGHQGGIVIHPRARIGDDCVIRQNATIGAATPDQSSAAPTLGNRVELGAGAVIIGAITIGDDVRIGPNAVVVTSIPAGATAFAAPAMIMPNAKRWSSNGAPVDARGC